MITVYYRISVGNTEATRRVAYIKSIDGGKGDVIRILVDGIENGRVTVDDKELLIKDYHADIKSSALGEGTIIPTIIDAEGHPFTTEGFIFEGGFVKRAPVPAGFSSKITEALDTVEREFKNLERLFVKLATAFSGEPLLKFDSEGRLK